MKKPILKAQKRKKLKKADNEVFFEAFDEYGD
jgi:hypothetical protein